MLISDKSLIDNSIRNARVSAIIGVIAIVAVIIVIIQALFSMQIITPLFLMPCFVISLTQIGISLVGKRKWIVPDHLKREAAKKSAIWKFAMQVWLVALVLTIVAPKILIAIYYIR